MKDKRKDDGAVDKSSSEQWFRESDAITDIVRKNWSPSHKKRESRKTALSGYCNVLS